MAVFQLSTPRRFQPVNPFLSTFLDSCWLEVVGEDIYASSAAGGLFRIDSTGKVLNSVDRPGLQLAGMAILNGELLVTHTNRDTGLTGIGRFDPSHWQQSEAVRSTLGGGAESLGAGDLSVARGISGNGGAIGGTRVVMGLERRFGGQAEVSMSSSPTGGVTASGGSDISADGLTVV